MGDAQTQQGISDESSSYNQKSNDYLGTRN
jgi:hypothetical protein